jgi:ribose 5-phosphate isomerase A
MTVGLGTGSTAAWFWSGPWARAKGLKLRCVATSQATAALAESLGLVVIDLDDAGRIDLTIDGADEIGPGLP